MSLSMVFYMEISERSLRTIKKKVLIIVGPTAVGKTSLSIQLAQLYHGEIISGDSMQIYKGLDVGTAKVKEEEKQGIPHYLIDCLDPEEAYSVADFQKEAGQCIERITASHHLPIVVGGTGLYLESLIYDVSHGQSSQKNEKYRKKMEDLAEENGRQAVWDILKEKDPKAAESIHPNNVRRVIRALEVIETSGELFSDLQDELQEKSSRYDTFIIGLNTSRELLYERINKRVDQMLEEGILSEARYLYEKQNPSLQSAKAIGYKEFFPYFSGDQTLQEAVDQLKKNSRRYAKRQLTWFRNRTPVDIWLNLIEEPEQIEEAKKEINKFLND